MLLLLCKPQPRPPIRGWKSKWDPRAMPSYRRELQQQQQQQQQQLLILLVTFSMWTSGYAAHPNLYFTLFCATAATTTATRAVTVGDSNCSHSEVQPSRK
eukprot:TRINITY_DN1485_c0_g5_i1.p1 TRINITY_DN1485_c0_g5~~TRINITY_DN1485_c0_g5_i1.p1  ORF type:complete len:100 (+),score=7.68 TRINITY_DN1485_c0_g5_i1:22-321(+)